jgi:hypothetical protein
MKPQIGAKGPLEVTEAKPGWFLPRWAREWDQFFFRPADPATLGLVRLCCGLIALYTAIAFCADLQEFFGPHAWVDLQLRNDFRYFAPYKQEPWTWDSVPNPDYSHKGPSDPDRLYVQKWGVYPEHNLTYGRPVWSIWFHVTDPTAMILVQAGVILVMFLFTIGLFTRVTSVLAWFCYLSYVHRAPTATFGVDVMMSIALFYLMIGPSGAAFSADRLLRRWWVAYRARRQALREGQEPPALRLASLPVTPLVSANLAIRLFQMNTAIIYLAAGISKLQGKSWWIGEAIWGTLANFEYAPMQYPAYTAFLVFLCHHPWLWQVFMTAGTTFTLVFEISFAFLVWGRRTRWLLIAMAVILHGVIGLFMGLKTFSMMMLTLVLSFVPPETIRSWLAFLAGLWTAARPKASLAPAPLRPPVDTKKPISTHVKQKN